MSIKIYPADREIPKGIAYVISYSNYFLVLPPGLSNKYIIQSVSGTYVIYPPFRLAPTCWRPIPQLTAASAKRVIGYDLNDMPLQMAVTPALAVDGTSALQAYCGDGSKYDPSLPPDSVIICALDVDDNHSLEKFLETEWASFLAWLRVRTDQWWIGKAAEGHTGNMHFAYETGPEHPEGRLFSPRARQTAPSPSISLINEQIWTEFLMLSSAGVAPPWIKIMRLDIQHSLASREFSVALLAICGWIESLRDKTLDNSSVKLKALGVGTTDLLKQISVGFEKIFGINASIDIPHEFEFIKSAWIARGRVAHGKTMDWTFKNYPSARDIPSNEIENILLTIEEWFSTASFKNTL